jgi:hypothetical protein
MNKHKMELIIVFDKGDNDRKAVDQFVSDVLGKLTEVNFPCCCNKFDYEDEKTTLRFIYHYDSNIKITNGQEILNIIANKLLKSNINFSDIALEVEDDEE